MPQFAAATETALADHQTEFDSELRAILGEARFAHYQTNREWFAEFNQIKFSSGDRQPLTEDRAEWLLEFAAGESAYLRDLTAGLKHDEVLGDPAEFIRGYLHLRVQTNLPPDQVAVLSEILLKRVRD